MAESQVTPVLPQGVILNVGYDYDLAPVCGCAARAMLRANLHTVDWSGIGLREARGRAMPDVNAVLIEEQYGTEHPIALRLDHAHEFRKSVRQGSASRNHLQNSCLSLAQQFCPPPLRLVNYYGVKRDGLTGLVQYRMADAMEVSRGTIRQGKPVTTLYICSFSGKVFRLKMKASPIVGVDP
jgi:hypothetical protein